MDREEGEIAESPEPVAPPLQPSAHHAGSGRDHRPPSDLNRRPSSEGHHDWQHRQSSWPQNHTPRENSSGGGRMTYINQNHLGPYPHQNLLYLINQNSRRVIKIFWSSVPASEWCCLPPAAVIVISPPSPAAGAGTTTSLGTPEPGAATGIAAAHYHHHHYHIQLRNSSRVS